MSCQAEGRKSLSEIDGLSSEEAKVLQELCRIKEGIMSLKEACVEAKGDKEQIPAELIDMGLKGQAAITKWVRPLHQLCSLKASNIWAYFDYSSGCLCPSQRFSLDCGSTGAKSKHE